MGTAIGLRDDFDGAALRRLSRATKIANRARRLLALAEIYDGSSRTTAARIGGVGCRLDRVPRGGVRAPSSCYLGRVWPFDGQAATAGSLTKGSSLKGATLSRVM